MKVEISNEIIIEGPNIEIKEWCKKNLVYKNKEYYDKLRMGKWLGNTPSTFQMYKVIADKYILPFGIIKQLWPMIKDQNVIVKFKQNNVVMKSHIQLYDYQETAVNEIIKAKNGVLVSKAGSGKTQMMLEVIARIGMKALWINNKKDLMNQALERAKVNISNCTFGTITEGKVDIGDITFSTIQTLSNIDLDALKNEFSIIVCDEFQNFSGTPTKLTQSYKVLSKLAARYKFGCTACVHRSDGLMKAGLDLIGDVVYEVPESAIADKIVRAKVIKKFTSYEPNDCVLGPDGLIKDFGNLLNDVCIDMGRNALIAEDIIANKDKHCIVLSDRLDQLRILKNTVGTGVMIDGGMTSKKAKEERRQAIEKMKTGEEKILYASYSLAKEGLDVPILDRLFLASPKKDKSVIIQSVGRIERAYQNKIIPLVYDYVDQEVDMLLNMYTQRKRVYKKNGNEVLDYE